MSIWNRYFLQRKLWVGLNAACFFTFWDIVHGVASAPRFLLQGLLVCLVYQYVALRWKSFCRPLSLVLLLLCTLIVTLSDTLYFPIYSSCLGIVLIVLYRGTPKITGLRQIPYLKNAVISCAWVCFALMLNRNLTLSVTFLVLFFYIFALIIPFDIRDREKDKIMTLPKRYGVAVSKAIAVLSLCISGGFAFLFLSSVFSAIWSLSCALAALAVLLPDHEKSRVFPTIGVEICLSLPLLFYLVYSALQLAFQQ